jgi:hypothetical protein
MENLLDLTTGNFHIVYLSASRFSSFTLNVQFKGTS